MNVHTDSRKNAASTKPPVPAIANLREAQVKAAKAAGDRSNSRVLRGFTE